MKLILLTLLLLLTYLCCADEAQERAIIYRTTLNLYETDQYERLVNTIDGYLNREERTGSGVWKHGLAYLGVSQVFNLETTLESYWDQQLQKAEQLTEEYPQTPIFYLIHADGLIRKALMYRTNKERRDNRDYKVQFQKTLAVAHDYMEQIKNKASSDPRWYDLMLMIAKEQNWNKVSFNTLVTEAMNKYPLYYEIYFKAVK